MIEFTIVNYFTRRKHSWEKQDRQGAIRDRGDGSSFMGTEATLLEDARINGRFGTDVMKGNGM